MKQPIRCAIYTRKSTEEGLEHDFNSLDAQRQACEDFARSQKALGWRPSAKSYDDGGWSGGSMDRPALESLLCDIAKGKIDLVIVYKVDRLTRSLADFARIVDLFDQHDVSFVSVTQQFNTASSMGRLTLNVLLSFAQFEREVTAERIRDKIAASKRKGMWMGGTVPLGYDAKEKSLMVNEAEARTVRALFRLYLAHGSVAALKCVADAQGLRTKVRSSATETTGGRPFTRGHLYQLLRNPIYVGEVRHKGKTYPGLHEPIVDRDTWSLVQSKLNENAVARQTPRNGKQFNLLAGLLFDKNGRAFSPNYAVKKGRRYRYYVSKGLDVGGNSDARSLRLPAPSLEDTVCRIITKNLRDQKRLTDKLNLEIETARSASSIISAASTIADNLASSDRVAMRRLLKELVRGIVVTDDSITVELSTAILKAPSRSFILKEPLAICRRGVEAKIVLPSGNVPNVDERLIDLVADARHWLQSLADGTASSIRQLASLMGRSENDITRFIQLAFLAPDIVEEILKGQHPVDLTAEKLKRLPSLPHDWVEQRRILGFYRQS